MIIYDVSYEIYPASMGDQFVDRLQDGGWRVTQEPSETTHLVITKPFVGLSSRHAEELAKADFAFMMNDEANVEIRTGTRRRYTPAPQYRWKLIPPYGRTRTYKYEYSARNQHRWLGGELYRQKIVPAEWEVVQ